jgi:hypothetical protein
MFEEAWELSNESPRRKFEQQEVPLARERQRALFCGLECLPGQRDLFPTDGEAERDASIIGATTVGVGDHGGH